MPGGYGKPALGGAAKKDVSETSPRPIEADCKTVDSVTGLRLTATAAVLLRKYNYLSRPRKYML